MQTKAITAVYVKSVRIDLSFNACDYEICPYFKDIYRNDIRTKSLTFQTEIRVNLAYSLKVSFSVWFARDQISDVHTLYLLLQPC